MLPQIQAMNFVLDAALDGGVNSALNLDSHGKTLSFRLLDLPFQVPVQLIPLLVGVGVGVGLPDHAGSSAEGAP